MVGRKVARSIVQVNKGHLNVSHQANQKARIERLEHIARFSSTALEMLVSTSFGRRDKKQAGVNNLVNGYYTLFAEMCSFAL